MGKLLITRWLSERARFTPGGLSAAGWSPGILQALLTTQAGGGPKKEPAVVGRWRDHVESGVSGPSSDSHKDVRQISDFSVSIEK